MRLLAERESSGLVVRLFWNDTAGASESEVVLEYEDRNEDVLITLYPPRGSALDAFYHPNAYRDCTRSWTRHSVRV
jgi:hypothetical protein